MHNKLIMIEGLPGTGKTTLSRWLQEYFLKQGENATVLLEGDENIPCDFYETAGIKSNDFKILCDNNTNDIAMLLQLAIKANNYCYLRIDKCPEHIAKQIKRWDMGDERNQMMSIEHYIPCALEKLKYWVDNVALDYDTVIIDSGFLQNPINELLFRKATKSEVLSFLTLSFAYIKKMNPICIYLKRKSAKESIDFARDVKGEQWAESVENSLKELGCESLFEDRFNIEQLFLPSINHLICHINGDDWSLAKQDIETYFGK